MRRVRIMLAAIAILAVVAGALAFRARNRGDLFCVAEPTYIFPGIPTCADFNGILTCQDLTEAYTTEWPMGQTLCYRTLELGVVCTETNCPRITFFTDTE